MIRCLILFLPLLLTRVLRADDWRTVTVPGSWESAAPGYDGVAWYRTWLLPHGEFFTPHERNLFEESVSLSLPDESDAHEAFVNGVRVGGAGQFPPDFKTGREGVRRAARLVPPRDE